MAQSVSPIPEYYPRVTPYLMVREAAEAIEFYKTVFGAVERMRMDAPGGKIGHAELQIGDSVIMLSDACSEMQAFALQSNSYSPVNLLIYVENVDAVFAHALQLGARQIRAVENQFYGDRSGMLQDPFGHCWNIATHVEDVPPEEMGKRAQAAMQAMCAV